MRRWGESPEVAEDSDPMAPYRRQQRVTAIVVALSFAAIVVFVGGFLWLFNRAQSRTPAPPAAVSYESYRSAWESAMAKAGVEATFPVEPVNLADVRATGVHEFTATFTAEEIGALLTMYRSDYTVEGGSISVESAVVGFPADDRASIDGRLVFDGSRYGLKAEASVTYKDGRIVAQSEGADLTVEGFGVKGDKRAQAIDLVANFLNAHVRAAPNLIVDEARVVEGALEVTGRAPVKIEHPTAGAP
ncbi:MAG: hypothetical protein Q8K99_06185 [Actinomycetota bacterium]|nr:hypothetical protein [Actinomycetota bacterium]